MLVPRSVNISYQPTYDGGDLLRLFGSHAQALLTDSRGRLLLASPVPLFVYDYYNARYACDADDGSEPTVALDTYCLSNNNTNYTLQLSSGSFTPAGTTSRTEYIWLGSKSSNVYVQRDERETFYGGLTTTTATEDELVHYTYRLLKKWWETTYGQSNNTTEITARAVDITTGSIALDEDACGKTSFTRLEDTCVAEIQLEAYSIHNTFHQVTLSCGAYGSSYRITGTAVSEALTSTMYHGRYFAWCGRNGVRATFIVNGSLRFNRFSDQMTSDEYELVTNGATVQLCLYRCTNHTAEVLTDDDSSAIATRSPSFTLERTLSLCSVGGTLEASQAVDIADVAIELEANKLYYLKLVVSGGPVHIEDTIEDLDAPLPSGATSVYGGLDCCQVYVRGDLLIQPA